MKAAKPKKKPSSPTPIGLQSSTLSRQCWSLCIAMERETRRDVARFRNNLKRALVKWGNLSVVFKTSKTKRGQWWSLAEWARAQISPAEEIIEVGQAEWTAWERGLIRMHRRDEAGHLFTFFAEEDDNPHGLPKPIKYSPGNPALEWWFWVFVKLANGETAREVFKGINPKHRPFSMTNIDRLAALELAWVKHGGTVKAFRRALEGYPITPQANRIKCTADVFHNTAIDVAKASLRRRGYDLPTNQLKNDPTSEGYCVNITTGQVRYSVGFLVGATSLIVEEYKKV